MIHDNSIISQRLHPDLKSLDLQASLKEFDVWNAFRTGNDEAFIFIYETYFDRLYAYGMRIVGDGPLVEDAIQELFIDLRNHRERINATDSIKFYLFKCLKRKLHREASKWMYKREELDGSHYFDFTISHEQHLIDKQVGDDELNRLNEAIQNLSLRKKEIIYYFFYEELDYRQIQEIMNLESIKSARNLLYKALNFLRDRMNP